MKLLARKPVWIIAVSMMFGLLSGCDSSDEPAPAETPEAGDPGADNTTPSDDSSATNPQTPDPTATPPEEEEEEEEAIPELAYPEGPYGTGLFEVIENLAFWDPWTDSTITLADYHNDPGAKLLILTSAAAWCGPCQVEAQELGGYYDEYYDQGLRILYTMSEDYEGQSLFGNENSTDAHMQLMNNWKESYGVEYPFVPDPDFIMEPYFTENAVPLTVILTTEDMRIRYLDLGYSSAFLDYQILKYIRN